MTNFEKVGIFMKTFGQEVKTKAELSNNKINELRISLINEELEELTLHPHPPLVLRVLDRLPPLVLRALDFLPPFLDFDDEIPIYTLLLDFLLIVEFTCFIASLIFFFIKSLSVLLRLSSK